jgi:dienelactone hydrolase
VKARARLLLLLLVAVLAAMTIGVVPGARAAAVTTLTGELPDGATWKAEVPGHWNGTLLLYSHGYRFPGSANPAADVGDPITGSWLLDHGFAIAGSSYAGTGWAIDEAIRDQLALLDELRQRIGQPRTTVAWGHSLGGMITAGLVQVAPRRFDGALPMCGVLAGAVGTWNVALDSLFAFKTLLAPDSGLQIARISDPLGSFQLAQQLLASAEATPQGRARLALVAALGDLPGWTDAAQPEPAEGDLAAMLANQIVAIRNLGLPFGFFARAEVEARAGGNPSWNTGVDYARQLRRSVDRREVEVLYRQAHLSLGADLRTLAAAPRISADRAAVRYLTEHIVYDGDLGRVPVLTIHTTDDPLVLVEQEQAYASAVARAGDSALLRQAFVHRGGHCTFTPAEQIAALQTLLDRVHGGSWRRVRTDPVALNARALTLGPQLNVSAPAGTLVPTAPAYTSFEPAEFLRPFDLAPSRAHGKAA